MLILLFPVLFVCAWVGAVPNTNAERIAKGFAPLKPKRLFDASKPRAHLPRASLTPNYNSIQIAAGPYGPPTRKRDVPGSFSVDTTTGAFIYTSGSDQASQFSFVDSTQSSLSWTAPTTSGLFIQGQTYAVYAQLVGNIYYVRVGTPPIGAVTTIFASSRYDGDLNPTLGTNRQFIWITDSNQEVILSKDVATAAAAVNSATVLLVQYWRYGGSPSLAAAQASQSEGTSMTNPVWLYARTNPGANGYVSINTYYSTIGVYNNVNQAATFYAPTLGNGMNSHQLYALVVQASTTYYTLTATQLATGVYFIKAVESDGTASADALGFGIPNSESGQISMMSPGGAPLNLYRGGYNMGAPPGALYEACDSLADCNAYFQSVTPMCLEVTPAGTAASVCDNQAVQNFMDTYSGQSSIYVYDPSGTYTGYMSFPYDYGYGSDATISSNPTSVYFDPSNSGQTQPLYSLINTVYFEFQQSADPGGSTAYNLKTYPMSYSYSSANAVEFNLPANPSQGGLVTLKPAAYLNPTSTSYAFFAATVSGAPQVYACADASSCGVASATAVCAEIVPHNGVPSYCVTATDYNPY